MPTDTPTGTRSATAPRYWPNDICLPRSSASSTAVSSAALAIWWPLTGARIPATRAAVTCEAGDVPAAADGAAERAAHRQPPACGQRRVRAADAERVLGDPAPQPGGARPRRCDGRLAARPRGEDHTGRVAAGHGGRSRAG